MPLPSFAQNVISSEQIGGGNITSEPENSDATFTHHTADVNGVRLHYVMGGQGDPLVLLHGWTQTSYAWNRIMPALAERYTVIAPDTRGLGDSSKPDSGYDKRTMAEDIYQLVQHLGFDDISLVGHDIGGQIAYAYANAYSEDVNHLAILEVPIPGLEGWENVSSEQSAWHFQFHAVPDLPEALVTGRERIYFSHFYENYAYDPTAITEADINEYLRTYSNPDALHAGFEYYRAFPEDTRYNREHIKMLDMPVLALGGESTLGDFPLIQLQTVAKNIRGGTMQGCGHYIPDECAEALTEELLSFLGDSDHPVSQPPLVNIPEPSSTLSILAFGAFSAGVLLKHRQRQTETSKLFRAK
ncbi:alpha/beta hydrolase [Nostoc linckia FACHB-391]|uniref:Alpha/beta hydrolase n=3 Tax=Nostoc TaxID=1177 RepID=A0ABR8IAK8_9NOSO|nr:alpha/beta hydrolase [Nostoc linckia FACHB-391]MBD2647560.1 alpha/beta hydrolase [Nostoc foliaceum FACHB-393]